MEVIVTSEAKEGVDGVEPGIVFVAWLAAGKFVELPVNFLTLFRTVLDGLALGAAHERFFKLGLAPVAGSAGWRVGLFGGFRGGQVPVFFDGGFGVHLS